MSRSIKQKDLKILFGRAAGRCAFPTCRVELVASKTEFDSAQVIANVAHIVAHSDDGPRADPTYPRAQRSAYDNLVLLCPTHHDLVDAQDNTYTVETLRAWKSAHEKWVDEQLREAVPRVSFAELEVVTRAIADTVPEPDPDLNLLAVREKLTRNDLSSSIHALVALGLVKAREVEGYVEHAAQIDDTFPDRLKAGFTNEYAVLTASGLHGDRLFRALHVFASRGRVAFNEQAAGLAVLTYLFEKCDVFEK